jgi:hypothetical protein
MRFAVFIILAGLGPVFSVSAQTQSGDTVNALLLVDSAATASGREFRKYLADNGVRILNSYPPHAFLGYVPASLDSVLATDYGAAVYRTRIADPASLSGYGENTLFAVSIWNKRFADDVPGAPQAAAGFRVQQAPKKGEATVLSWGEMMKADGYRLQISPDSGFGSLTLETRLTRNSFEVYPAFFRNGVYYWRVSGLMTLNTGERREGPFSEAFSFTISKPSQPAKAPLPAPALPGNSRLKSATLFWDGNPAFKRYRLQISPTADFASPVLDVFTNITAYKLSGLPLARETTYYMRIMGADDSSGGTWSGASEIVLENPGPVLNDVRRPARSR